MNDTKRLIKLLEINNDLMLLNFELKLFSMDKKYQKRYFELKERNDKIKLMDGEKL